METQHEIDFDKNSFIVDLHKAHFDDSGRICVLEWNDGRTDRFHIWWLKDNCPSVRNQNGQHLRETRSLDLNIVVNSLIHNEQTLFIEWSDGTTSGFPYSYLRHHAYGSESSVQRFGNQLPIRELWNANSLRKLHWHDFSEITRSDQALFHWLDDCARYGVTLLKNVPHRLNQVESIIGLFGQIKETNYGRVFDVRTVIDPQNLAYSSKTLGAHVDNPYRNPTPTLQLLHCLNNDQPGGESTLVDGFFVANQLKQDCFDNYELLSKTSIDFEYRAPGTYLRDRKPVIQTNNEGNVESIFYNDRSTMPIHLPIEKIEGFYTALIEFADLLESPDNRIQFKLNSGQAMLFDNTRVLHGRTGFLASGNRHLQGCYCDRDSLLSKWAVLNARLSNVDH